MNLIDPTFESLVSRPVAAVVQAAFDEERALAKVQEAIGRRDDAKGEYQDAILEIGRTLAEARRAMPGPIIGGVESYGPRFLAFIEKCGLAKHTAKTYMSYARDPQRLFAKRERNTVRGRNQTAQYARRKTLEEIVDMLRAADSIEQAIETIQGELNEAA